MSPGSSLQVYKFGGASVKDAAAILNLCRIVRDFGPQGPLVIVVSAMGKTTNALEEIFQLAYAKKPYQSELDTLLSFHLTVAFELFGEEPEMIDWNKHNPYEALNLLLDNLRHEIDHVDAGRIHSYDEQYDQIVGYGELLSSLLVQERLNLPATDDLAAPAWKWLDARRLIRTDETWREAKVDWQTTKHNLTALPPPSVGGGYVTQGFIGGSAYRSEAVPKAEFGLYQGPRQRTTTLGREGSDYTAAILAYCLRAESVTIWKDVAGLLNADPKIFPDTVRYPEISYQETIEMAYYGASVIHPKTIKPLAERGIPLYVKSFLDPSAEGTVIHDCRHGLLAPAFIRKTGQCLVSFESKDFAFISEENLEVIFGALAQARLKINLMQNSAISFSVCLDYSERRLNELLALLREQFTIHYNTDLTLFTIKNYDAESVQQLTSGRRLLLEQRTRQTFQVVCA